MKLSGLSGITFQQVEIFLAAARYENFTKAAEVLYMTQASVSRNILSMEMALGLVLFIRHKRRVALTNAGKSLAADLRQILRQTENALDHAFLQQQNQFRSLTVGDVDCTSMDDYLLPVTREFERLNPSVELLIERGPPTAVYDNLLAGKYDASFFLNLSISELLIDGLQSDLIFELTPCVVLASTHPLFHRETVSIEDLQGQPLVAMREGLYMRYWHFAHQVCRETGIGCDDVKFVDNVFTLAMELKRSGRIAIMDVCFAPMNQEELRYIPLGNCRTKSGVVLLYSKDNMNPYLTKFRQVCRELGPELIRATYQ